MKQYCINCTVELCCLDDDPNGDKNAVCAQCRAEEDHDFDVEPNVKFERNGHRTDDVIVETGVTVAEASEFLREWTKITSIGDPAVDLARLLTKFVKGRK